MKKVSPKKHLGQHFLVNENVATRIVEALLPTENKVVEIGPGMGVLTKHLLGEDDFVAYDIDNDSIEYLRSQYESHRSKFILKDFLQENFIESKFDIIGNLPYNISSQIFFKVYELKDIVSTVVCMVQKEVADRVSTREGSKQYGILSVLLQTWYNIEYLFTVKPGSFNPPPKVNSGVIRLIRNDRLGLPCDEKLFTRVVKTSFGKRRKTLRNALKEFNLPTALTDVSVFSKRAEQLSVQEFIELTVSIEKEWKA